MNFASTEDVWQKLRRPFFVGLTIVVIVGTFYIFMTVGGEEKRLTIAVKQGVESVVLKEIAQKFSRDKHVSVEVVELPYDDLYAEEQRQLADRPLRKRDSVPPFDVIMVDDPWLYALVSNPNNPDARRLMNLNHVVKPKDNDFFPSALRVSTYCPSRTECSDYYAVPFVANSQLFAYRGADFAKSEKPTTWKQVLDASKEIEKTGGIGYVTRIGPGNSIVTDFMPILWAYDPGSFPEFPTKGDALQRPEDAFSTLKTLVATRKNLGSASFDDFDVSAYLQKQRASMGIVWSAWAMMLVDIENSTEQGVSRHASTFSMSDCLAKVTKAPLLRFEDLSINQKKGGLAAPALKEKLVFGNVPFGPGQEPRPELGVWLLAIPTGSEREELALEFVKYATDLDDDPDVRLRRERSLLAAHRGTPPPRVCVLAELQEDPTFKDQHPSLIPAIAWSLDNGRARPRTACWKKIESQLGTYLEQLIDQGVKPDGITEKANERLAPLFNDETCRAFLKSADNR
jgi:multiple sugar transport system substrate-binding protein